jgi:hypothetical protein
MTEKTKHCPFHIKEECSLSPILIDIILENVANAITTEQEIEGAHIGGKKQSHL